MSSENEKYLQPGEGHRPGRGRATSERKAIAARLNPIKNGRQVKAIQNRDKPRHQLLFEKALLSQGVSADQVNQLAAKVLANLHRTGELLEDELSFATSGQYTKLTLDVARGLKELVPEQKNDTFDAASTALLFLRSKGRDDLAAELSQLFMREQLTRTNTSNVGNEGTTALPVVRSGSSWITSKFTSFPRFSEFI